MTLLETTMFYANKIDYFRDAKKLGLTDQQLIERLANDYRKAKSSGDENLKNNTMAGLMVKFWYQQKKMAQECRAVTLYTYEDYYPKLYSCIDIGCDYGAWLKEGATTNAQACINQVIASRGAAEILYQSNRDKHKSNINVASLDKSVSGEHTDDHEVSLGDLIADDSGIDRSKSSTATGLIQMYVKEGKLVEAIILDNIAFEDSLKYTKEINKVKDEDGNVTKTVTGYREFWNFRLVRLLNNLDPDYAEYFTQKYKANSVELKVALEFVANSTNQKLYNQIDKCLNGLRKLYKETGSLII